jgi:single-strand DNA-binding protein
VEKYVKKGSKLYIEGKITNRQYEKDGQTKYYTSIIADSNGIIPLDRKESNYSGSSDSGGSFTESAPAQDDTSEEKDDLPF